MITRRQALIELSYSATCMLLWSKLLLAESSNTDSITRKFLWRVPEAHFETVKRELTFDGDVQKEQDTKGVWVFIFIGAVLIPYLAKAILALRREIVNGGIIIDTRNDKIKIDTDKSLPGGIIVLITPEGTTLYERSEISDPSELVTALSKGL